MSTLTEPRIATSPARASSSRRFDGRLAALLGVAVAGLVALIVAIATSLTTGESPPATGAAALVPADTLAYVHLSTDPGRPADKRALRLAARLPGGSLLLAGLTARLDAILGTPRATATLDFGSEIRPWLGSEAAFALLDTPSTTADTLIVLDVRHRARARRFLARAGARPIRTYRGVTELRFHPGTVLAFVKHYLAIGQRSSVESAIDVASGQSSSLQSDPAYRRAASVEPAGRVLDAYLSAPGVRRVLLPRGGLLGAAGALLDHPALAGVSVSLSAVSGGVQVIVHRALIPALARTGAGARMQFAPTLPSALPRGSSLLLDVRDLPRAAPEVLSATATAGIAPRVGSLLRRLGVALGAQGVDLPQALSLFSGETALALVPPRPARHGGPVAGPALAIVARTDHPDQSRALMAGLEAPLGQLFPPPNAGPGQAPVWNDVQVAGVSAHQLSIAPGLQLDYAVFRGILVISTSLHAIGAIADHQSSLADEPAYHAALAGSPDQVTSLGFADFSQLLNLGEQMGLIRSARLSAARPDLERIRGVGVVSSRGEADTTAELFLQIK